MRADLQGQYARVWHAVAAHYRGNPAVVGYEVVNEPNALDLRVKGGDEKVRSLTDFPFPRF